MPCGFFLSKLDSSYNYAVLHSIARIQSAVIMSFIPKFLFQLAYVLGFFVANFCTYVTRQYYNSKPLGMQTILGKIIIKESYAINAGITIYSSFLLFTLSCNVSAFANDLMCKSITATFLLLYIWMCLGFWFCLVIRYASIYHGTLLEMVDENTVMSKINWVLGIAPLTLTLLEYTLVSKVEDSQVYDMMCKCGSEMENEKYTIELTKVLHSQ